MKDTKERLSLLWLFVLLNYLYADVVGLFAIAGSRNPFAPLSPWALMGSAVLMEIPIGMIVASRLLPFRANRLANIIGCTRDLRQRFLDVRSAAGRLGQAARFSRVSVLRDDRDRLHRHHHPAGVEVDWA